jgi:non-ribosomal peptide synthetase component F
MGNGFEDVSRSVLLRVSGMGRDAPIPGIDDAVGPFINMLVRHVRLSGEDTVSGPLDQIHDDCIASLPHQHYLLAHIYKLLNLGSETLFNSVFTY